ncbi:hypothetical protein ABPG72_011034 [Tetrahymena utriculariae]
MDGRSIIDEKSSIRANDQVLDREQRSGLGAQSLLIHAQYYQVFQSEKCSYRRKSHQKDPIPRKIILSILKTLKNVKNYQAEDGENTNLLLFEVLLSKCYIQGIMKPVHSLGGIVQEKKLRMTARDEGKLSLTALKFSADQLQLKELTQYAIKSKAKSNYIIDKNQIFQYKKVSLNHIIKKKVMKSLSFVLSSIIMLYVAIPSNAYPILTGADLQNVSLIPLNYNNCIKTYPRACCFQGQATLTTKYDAQSIKSITLKGNQIGQNCPNELVFLPIRDNTSEIIMNKFYIRTDYDQLTYFLFYTGSRSQVVQGQTKYDYQFSLHLYSKPRQNNIFQDFMLKNTLLPIEEQISLSFTNVMCFNFTILLLAIQIII